MLEITHPSSSENPPACPSATRQFRRKLLDLVAAGRRVAQAAADLDISDQTIYVWHRQRLGYLHPLNEEV